MKDKYTIGEVAALLNISPQTLRFYDKNGIVIPHYTDPKTGYRYYSYDQISYISRVKYLQQFGFSLDGIKKALATNDTHFFRTFLQQQRQVLQAEAQRITSLLEDLDWYIDYYGYLKSHNYKGVPYIQQEPERYLLTEQIHPGEDIYGSAGKRLTQMQHSSIFTDTHFRRCHGYLLNFSALLKGRIFPTHYFVYLREQPTIQHPNLITVPNGSYLCIQNRILSETFEMPSLNKYFRNTITVPIVLANEYEDNFTNFRDSVYEIQIQTGTGF